MQLTILPEPVPEEMVIRPPSEAHSIIIQATRGCSHNRCIFCGVYKGVRFELRDDNDIDRQLDFARQFCKHQNRVFIGAGDALIMPQKKILKLFKKIRSALPWINRVSLYANGKGIRSKSDSDLEALRLHGLDRVYMGIESGDDYLLGWMKKGETADTLFEAGNRIAKAGMFLSTTVLLGIGGTEYSQQHSRATARLLNRIQPNQIGALCLMVLENTELGKVCSKSQFVEMSAEELVRELKEMISGLTLDRVQFMANHASNFLPLSGRLQKDKQKFLMNIDEALANPSTLVSPHLRAL
ncbi:MAG: radical SAM protein [Desulfocapsaceae bacterium]